ncbi:MAG: hypothetical protein ABJC19_04390 [Gemmatimonadota bacterium]
MRRLHERFLRALVRRDRVDELIGDLEEESALRGDAACWRDVVSLCLRQSRFRVAPECRALLAVVALGAAVVVMEPAPIQTVVAQDAAGSFTLAFFGRSVIGATMNGEAVPRGRVSRSGDVVMIRAATSHLDLRLRIIGRGTFEWEGRSR